MIDIRELDRVAPAPQLIEGMPQEWDKLYSDAFIESGKAHGLYIACMSYENFYRPYGSAGHAFAVVMSTTEAECLIKGVNRKGATDLAEAKRNLMPGEVLRGDTYARYEPVDYLPPESMMDHPYCAMGRTRQEALLKASEAHLRGDYGVGDKTPRRYQRWGKVATSF